LVSGHPDILIKGRNFINVFRASLVFSFTIVAISILFSHELRSFLSVGLVCIISWDINLNASFSVF